ncbi:hypothetical protein A2118_01990 [Candidatus Kaiserbacteria bacterium GWA2_50_9]|uniref:Uncharacterized protein n=1 Tax=Candidatus Kaiserbacteria bacterium GWA2_50_9 TaxID=1798474 RepID=A0A1F6BV10_9BACT|nr:MAG: hypothetical protein A2118_01990 [Candidatus Kaiserbacteria bacterium GWA2_50_9]
MSRNSTLILLGILTIFVPFSGLPIAFRTLFTVIFGACVAGIGLTLRAREARSMQPPVETQTPPPPPSSVSPI